MSRPTRFAIGVCLLFTLVAGAARLNQRDLPDPGGR